MRLKYVFLGLLLIVTNCASLAQPGRRMALFEANGPLARSGPIFAAGEARVADELTQKLAGQPGIVLIDRGSIDRILKEQDFQFSDRSSPETAVRIGKLLGAEQIALVNMYEATFSSHSEKKGLTTHNSGTQTLRVNVRILDVETGAILAQPAAQFQETYQINEVRQQVNFGQIQVPPKTTGADPAVTIGNEWTKACDTVTTELAAKLMASIAVAPRSKTPSALVAGIANGSVYINQGSRAGVKAGDKFQILREVSVGINDPETGRPIVKKSRVCILTIVDADESNSSGSCQGGLPQAKDVAQPLP